MNCGRIALSALALGFTGMVSTVPAGAARAQTDAGAAAALSVAANARNFVSVSNYGAAGDGVTDDTAAIQTAVTAAAASGDCVYFDAVGSTPAVYVISSIAMSAGQKVCLTGPGPGLVVLKHMAGSTVSMLTSGTDMLASFELSHLTVDGNQGPGGVTNRFVSGVEIYTDRGSIHDAEFKNTMYAGIRLWAVTYTFSIRNNWMHDFALHGPNPSQQQPGGWWSDNESTAAILINKAVASAGVVDISQNSIWMTTPPTGAGNSVGGIVISPDIDKQQMALVTANVLWNMGQELFHEQQGPIACDRNCDGTKIVGNVISNSYYNPIVVQRSSNFEIANNLITGEGDLALDSVAAIQLGGQQTDNLVPMHTGSIHHNTIDDVPHLKAIVANYDAGGEMTDLSITNNRVTNAKGGADTRYVIGRLQFTGNTFTNICAGTCGVAGDSSGFAGLRVRNAPPQGGPALSLDFSNNYFDAMGERPLYVNDESFVQEIYVTARGNYYRNVAFGGLTVRHVVYAEIDGNTSVGAPSIVVDVENSVTVRLTNNHAENTGTIISNNTNVVDYGNSWTPTSGTLALASVTVEGTQSVKGVSTFSAAIVSDNGIDASASTGGWGLGAAPSADAAFTIDRVVGNSSRSAEYNFVRGLNSGFALAGNLTNQRNWLLNGSTFTGSGGTRTITNYATLYIDAAGTAGANAAITNNYALWVRSGTTRFGGDVGIGTSAFTFSGTPPTVASGFGTTTSVAAGSTTVTWTITVTTAGGASSGVLNLPPAANGWRCTADNRSRPGPTKLGMSAMTTTTAAISQYNQTTGAPEEFVDGDVIDGGCSAR